MVISSIFEYTLVNSKGEVIAIATSKWILIDVAKGRVSKIDEELIRKYPSYYRADILGLTASKHRIDIVPVYNETLLNDAKASYDVKLGDLITVAFGTFTPPSTTVVDTST